MTFRTFNAIAVLAAVATWSSLALAQQAGAQPEAAPVAAPVPAPAPETTATPAPPATPVAAVSTESTVPTEPAAPVATPPPPPPPPAPSAQAAAGGPSEWDRWFGGKFMDTRVTFVFTDDNTLAGPRDRSPQAGFFNVNDEQFYEGLDTEKRGRENETQLVLYKRMPSYFHRVDAEAALVLQMEVGNESTNIGDNGSYLKLNFYTQRDDFDGDNVSVTFFPVDSQRMLLGYTYDITWGGEKIFPNNSGTVPGARLRYDFNVG